MKYIRVHPALVEKPEAEDFEDGNTLYWSHVTEDRNGNSVFFGDYGTIDGSGFDFDLFRLKIGATDRIFTWAQTRELGETLVNLADKHEHKEGSGNAPGEARENPPPRR